MKGINVTPVDQLVTMTMVDSDVPTTQANNEYTIHGIGGGGVVLINWTYENFTINW